MIYGIILGIILVLYFMNYYKIIGRKSAIVIISVVLIVVSGLRNPELGMSDTLTGYLPAWHIAIRTSFREMLVSYVGHANSGLKDVGFALYVKLLSYISQNDQFYLTMTVAPYIMAISSLIYKRSQNFFMSYFLFIGLNLYTCSFYLIRHVMAATFTVIAIEYLYKRRFWKFLLFVVIGATFHMSALIFILAYPLAWFRFSESSKVKRIFGKFKYLFVALLAVIVGMVGRDTIISLISLITVRSRFETAGGNEGGLGRFVIAMAILLICIYKTGKDEIKTNENRVTLVLSVMTCILYAFMPVMEDFHRFAKFYEIINIVWLPNSVKKERNVVTRCLIKWSIYIVIGLYMFLRLLPGTNALPYFFFWTHY